MKPDSYLDHLARAETWSGASHSTGTPRRVSDGTATCEATISAERFVSDHRESKAQNLTHFGYDFLRRVRDRLNEHLETITAKPEPKKKGPTAYL